MKTYKGKDDCAVHEGVTVNGDRAVLTLNLYTGLACVVSILYTRVNKNPSA